MPALLWPDAAIFFAAPAVGIEQLRAALSAAVCLVSARRTLRDVIASLGSATTAPAVSRVLQALRAGHRWPAMLAALTGLAETLDRGACPIDYARRRALPFEEFLSESHGARSAGTPRHRRAAHCACAWCGVGCSSE